MPSAIRLLFPVLREAALSWMHDKVMRLSAAVSFYTLISIAPMLIISLKIARLFWRTHSQLQERILQQLSVLMGPQVADALRPMLGDSSVRGGGTIAATVSAVVLLFSATGMFMELQEAMNVIWEVHPRPDRSQFRRYLLGRLLSLAMVLGIESLLLLSVAVTGLMAGITSQIGFPTSSLDLLKNVALPLLTAAGVFAVLYRLLPAVDLQWKHVWPGSLIAALLFTIGRYGLILYFRFGSPISVFGAAGTLTAVLLWVYYSSFSFFYGAEFTKSWASRRHGYQARLKAHRRPHEHIKPEPGSSVI